MTTTAVGLGFVAVRSPRHRSAAILGLGALMGAGYFIAIHGARVVDPQQIGWLHGDALDHFLGWHLFRHEPWQMPPGLIRTLVHPIGTSIGNTDSIPLFALMFKPFDAVLPADFQDIGLWLLCAFTLQGIFGVLLVRTMTASTLLQLIGSALLFLSPTMLYRLGHPALVSQWLLLASLWLYCRREHSGSTSVKFAPWGILLAVAAATHPYLCAMVFALACAAGARWALETPGHVMPTFIALLMLVIDVACVWWLLGYFVVRPGDMQSVGLEEFSMNLLSFVMPMTASAVLPEIPLARAGRGPRGSTISDSGSSSCWQSRLGSCCDARQAVRPLSRCSRSSWSSCCACVMQ